MSLADRRRLPCRHFETPTGMVFVDVVIRGHFDRHTAAVKILLEDWATDQQPALQALLRRGGVNPPVKLRVEYE
jgi:hypothetical protein